MEVEAVARGTREGEGEEEARWETQEGAEVYLQYLEGNQEGVAAVGGCGVAIWMLPRRVISGRWASNGYNSHVLPGGGPSGMGMSSSVSMSSSSLDMPGGGPSGMGISSSVSSTYPRIN